ncbi:MAG: spermidine/putrescine ABC transporter substrate-binding protein, partial [Anaerolinea sp.]|nr:spermidine/putrescine ABC transporter substrate-binding protein [Anaerolinea sp.]
TVWGKKGWVVDRIRLAIQPLATVTQEEVGGGGMRRSLLVLTVFLLTLAPLRAQVAGDGWTCPDGFAGQSLSVYNWSTYIAEDTVANFEAACDVTVLYDVYENNETLIARLRQGNPGYDIIIPTDYAVQILYEAELLVELDHSLIPNLVNVTPELLDLPFDPGNRYSVPYQWGTVGVGYRVSAVEEPVTSWEQVWNHDGPVAWLDDPRVMLGIALNLLGYDVNTADPAQIAEARDYLIERAGNVVAIAGDDGQARLQRGEVDIVIEYNGDIIQLIAESEPDEYAYVIPVEGSQLATDSMAIPVGAPNVPLAHAFIDYILDPQVGADISNYTGYGSPNQAAIDAGLIDEELLENPGIYPPAEVLERMFSIAAVAEAEAIYLSAWDEIKVSLGG